MMIMLNINNATTVKPTRLPTIMSFTLAISAVDVDIAGSDVMVEGFIPGSDVLLNSLFLLTVE